MEQDRAPAVLVHFDELKATPLVSYQVIVDLIGSTTTETGLTVRCELDTKAYPKGIAVSDRDIATINIRCDPFHGDWNYTILPRNHSGNAVNP